jgi:hypothetical protein
MTDFILIKAQLKFINGGISLNKHTCFIIFSILGPQCCKFAAFLFQMLEYDKDAQ